MRRSSWLFAVLCLVGCVPLFAHAQSTLQPIINLSGGFCTCPGSAPDWGCVLQTIQTGMNDIVAVAAILITLYIAWAGIGFMMSPTSPEARSKAVARIVNAVLGLLIALCAWLLVDSLLKVVYNTSASATGVAALGPWNAILADSNPADQCIKQVTNSPALPGLTAASNAGGGVVAPSSQPSATLNSNTGAAPACNASAVQAAAASEGVQISNADANTLACLAKPESACGTVLQNYKWGQGSSAYGAFQVTLSGNAQYYNNAACEAAAGVTGPLNCQTGFSGGNPISGSTVAAACEKAASNLGCSAAAAAALYDAKGISQWTADNNSTSQGSCGS